MTSGLKLALRQQGSHLGVASGLRLELLLFCFLNENSFAVFPPSTPLSLLKAHMFAL